MAFSPMMKFENSKIKYTPFNFFNDEQMNDDLPIRESRRSLNEISTGWITTYFYIVKTVFQTLPGF